MIRLTLPQFLHRVMIGGLMTLVACATANAAVLLNYRAGGGGFTVNATDVDANISADPLVAERGLRALGLTNGYGFGDWDPSSTSFDDAVAINDFWTWGFTVVPGENQITLDSFELRVGRNFLGPDDFEVRGSVNGGSAATLLMHDFNGSLEAANFFNVDLSTLGTLNPGDQVVFTLAAFNSISGPNGNFSLLNFNDGSPGLVIEGTVRAIPEPSSIVAMGLLAIVGWKLKRRGQKSRRS